MKPERGRYQAVTQVKGLSPENTNISEADTFHFSGRRNKLGTARGEVSIALTGSETTAWDQEDDLGTWETQGDDLMSGSRSNKL
jgi:phage gp45-like